MLIGISPLISPDLLVTLHRMGHGDEIVLADAHFPGETYGKRVLRADGIKIPAMLDAILPLFALDTYVESALIMMSAASGDQLDPAVEISYRQVIDKHWPDTPPILHIERLDFYNRTKQAFAVLMTGETVKYGNIILIKGVTPIIQK